jgi:hypothetical protein
MSGAPLADYPTGCNLALWVPANQLTGSNQWGKLPPAWVGVNQAGNLQLPTIGIPFTGSRADLRAGGMQDWDMSLTKSFPVKERLYLQISLQAFNVFNHPNFQDKGDSANLTLPSCNAGGCTAMSISPNSGFNEYTSQYTGNGGPRVVQLGAKISF